MGLFADIEWSRRGNTDAATKEGQERRKVMRKCTAKTYRKSSVNGKWETIDILGVFHQFAPQYDEFEAGPGNATIAIVEDIEGQVWSCAVESVKFIKD